MSRLEKKIEETMQCAGYRFADSFNLRENQFHPFKKGAL